MELLLLLDELQDETVTLHETGDGEKAAGEGRLRVLM